MRFKNCTLGYIKKIYMEKMTAQEQNDQDALARLKAEYPEIFDAKFLMDVLKNEFKRARKGLDDDMIFESELFKYH